MFGIGYFFLFLFVILAVALLVLRLWMLIDCLKRPDDKFAYGGANAKLIWILVIIFMGLIGALIYYFLIKINEKDFILIPKRCPYIPSGRPHCCISLLLIHTAA